ncbi:MAG: DUF3108 domain-containing protein [Blastocatellia bacterium]
MNISLQKTFKILLLFAAFAAAAFGQPNGAAANGNFPFQKGEKLTYEGKLSKIISGISVAELVFTIDEPSSEQDFLIKAEARSKGTLLKLFRYSFLQKVDSTISQQQFRAVKTVKHDVQKERIRNSEAVFDYRGRRVTYTETDPNEPMRPPRQIASEIGPETHDLISGIYSLRLLPLAVGKTFEISVSDSGLVYKIPVKVTARENQKSVLGRVWCFRLEPQVFGNGRLIEREGSMVIWITDDARRLPIRSLVNTNIGKLDIKLKAATNLRNPAQ